MSKLVRAGIFMAVLAVSLIAFTPAWASTAVIGGPASDVTLDEAGFRLEAPAKVNSTEVYVTLKNTDASKLTPISDFYVTKSVDIQMKNTSGGVVTRLAKRERLVFSFNNIDFKRASNMNTAQPVGRFRIGYWDESNKNWVELPSQIFWDGSNGVIEAETDQGDGRYALLWSNRGDAQLSRMAGQEIRVMIDNVPVTFTDAPYVKDGRTMVPLRAISNNLGAQVTWTASESRIDLVYKADFIKLWVGKQEALKNKQSITIDVPPEVVNGRTFVPLRFIVEAFGSKVSWDGMTHTVKIF